MELKNVTTTSGILEPGLWQLDPSRERYRVPACGVIVVELYPDDVLVVRDPEGGQHAEVVPFSPEGKGDPGILGINKQPLVSKDFNHNPHSSIFDVTQTQVIKGKFGRVLSWYDNEWGFSNRMCDTAIQIARLI